MVDTNMITAYFWACGIFQPDLPPALSDVDKRTKFVNEVNEVHLKYINNDINSQGHGQFVLDIKNQILNDIGEIGKSYVIDKEDDRKVQTLHLEIIK